MRIAITRVGPIHDLLRQDTLRYGRFDDEIEHRAAVLCRHLTGATNFIVIAHGGSASFFADLFAVWQAGACAVCINPTLTHGELANLVEFIKPSAVLIDNGGPQTADLGVPVICTREERPTGRARRSEVPATLDAPALMLFTSGTTGRPKGVVHTFRSMWARVALNRAHIGDERLSRTLCVLPTHFGHGLIGNCLTPLMAGAELFLYQDTSMRGAAALGEVLSENEITFMSSVPSFWRVALKVAGQPKRATLRQLHVGSAPLSAGLWQDIIDWSGTDNVLNMYGITETANWVSGAAASDTPPEDGLVGRMWGGSAMLKDAEGGLHAEGEGELILQTPSLMSGYHLRPDLTREVLRDGWLHSGDLGSIDAGGVIRLTGRQKDEINRAGVKVQPEEIDLLLERHPDVVEVCTFGMPDEVSGELVAAAVRLADAAVGIDDLELRRWCTEQIRRECVPERWFFVSEIPKTDRGKVSRALVREYCLSSEACE